jgi:hypothetical protein
VTIPADYQARYRAALATLTQADAGDPAATPPDHVADQLNAAADDTEKLFFQNVDIAGALDPTFFPGPPVERSKDRALLRDNAARVLAAMGDARFRQCVHLRRTPAQPANVRLDLHRADCNLCTGTVRLPPAGEDDRCDLCGSRGNSLFTPIMLTLGHWLVSGDVCGDCVIALQGNQEDAHS